MIVVDGVVWIAADERIVVAGVVSVTVIDAVGDDDAAAEGLQGQGQRWRAGGGRCRAPEAPARRTGGGYAAGRYRHAGVEWDSTWRALCHAHRRHHSPLHGALNPRRELPPGFGLDYQRSAFFLLPPPSPSSSSLSLPLSVSLLCSPFLLSFCQAFGSHIIAPSISFSFQLSHPSLELGRESSKRDLRQPRTELLQNIRQVSRSIALLKFHFQNIDDAA